jgi:hypothetical protein
LALRVLVGDLAANGAQPMNPVLPAIALAFAAALPAAAQTPAAGQASAADPAGVGTQSKAVYHFGSLAGADLGKNANLRGAVPFPANNAWNKNIAKEPVDPNSANLIASIPIANGLHPNFGSGTYQGQTFGIPYIVVGASQPDVKITFNLYPDQSDKGPYPVPHNAPIQGYRPDGGSFDGDRHVLVVDRDANRIYEMYRAFPNSDGSWTAGNGAVFHADSNNVRPTQKPGWTSADAAGLPIFPGLVRYDEAHSGNIPHALRFTVPNSRRAYVPPANHWASDDTNPNLPPMGMRVRLKSSYVIPKTFSRETKAILKALKKYGMIVADDGQGWFISGTADDRWDNNTLVSELSQVGRANFEVVKMQGMVTP